MQVVTGYPDGVFSWVDLATIDPVAAKAFYSGLFGWSFEDLETDVGTIYSMATLDGYNVCGLGPLPPGMADQGIPSMWTSYVNHSDVDAVAARISAAGGNVMAPPFDVMDSGRMTSAMDPTGAAFGVWQPKQHIGAQLVNRVNALVWNELQTNDVAAACDFYATVFGWTFETDASGYVAVSQDGRVQAGMMAIGEDWGEVPPNWSVYFMVADVNASAAKVAELGGKVLRPPFPTGEMGSLSVVMDPQGAVFNIMEFNGPVDPPPGF